jgi:hypothetical protein
MRHRRIAARHAGQVRNSIRDAAGVYGLRGASGDTGISFTSFVSTKLKRIRFPLLSYECSEQRFPPWIAPGRIRDHIPILRMIYSENRFPPFGIML